MLVECPLSVQELAIVEKISDGKKLEIVAYEMRVSRGSVVWSLKKAMDKVGVRTSPGIVALAIRKGWIR